MKRFACGESPFRQKGPTGNRGKNWPYGPAFPARYTPASIGCGFRTLKRRASEIPDNDVDFAAEHRGKEETLAERATELSLLRLWFSHSQPRHSEILVTLLRSQSGRSRPRNNVTGPLFTGKVMVNSVSRNAAFRLT